MILGPMPASSEGQDVPRVKPTADLSTLLGSLYGDPILTREQEVHLFRKMNFLKHQAARLRVARSGPGQGRGRRPRRGPRDGGAGRQESNRLRQPPAGRLGGQEAQPSQPGLRRAGLRRVPRDDPSGGEVRLLAGLQVQHVCLVGDHEQPVAGLAEGPPARPVRHRLRGDARGRPRPPGRRVLVRAGSAAVPGGDPRNVRPAERPRANRSSSAGSAWKAPARRPSTSSARNWGSPRNGCVSSRPAPATSSARSPRRDGSSPVVL